MSEDDWNIFTTTIAERNQILAGVLSGCIFTQENSAAWISVFQPFHLEMLRQPKVQQLLNITSQEIYGKPFPLEFKLHPENQLPDLVSEVLI